MRFVDLLKTTVLVSAAAATMLAVITIVESNLRDDPLLVPVAFGWWVVAILVGVWLGRRSETSPPVAKALRDARTTTSLPELRPARVLLNRLWPILLATIVSATLSIAFPQIAAIAAGFGVILALAWRRQDAAVTAIEERDGVTFYVESTAPTAPIKLVRTPGLRRDLPPAALH